MTNRQEHIALRDRLREVLGIEPASTLMTMLRDREDLATKSDLSAVRDELKGDIAQVRLEVVDLRSEVALIRSEMEHRYATKDDLFECYKTSDASLRAFVRTFTAIQAATVVGVSGIVFGLTRFL